MTLPLTAAYSELTRVLPWSLRALGYKFGVADRGAHLIATAAAMDPAALDAVANAKPRPGRDPALRRTPDGLTIDAQGVSLLEVGPAAADHLAAHADEASFRICLIVGATEPALLPAVVATAASYGVGCLAVVVDGDARPWALGSPDDEGGRLALGEDIGTLVGILGDRTDVAAQASAMRHLPGAVLLAVGRGVVVAPPADAIRPAQMIWQAQQRGVPVTQATLDALYGLEMLTWAPTSERSRSQAGFSAPAGVKQ